MKIDIPAQKVRAICVWYSSAPEACYPCPFTKSGIEECMFIGRRNRRPHDWTDRDCERMDSVIYEDEIVSAMKARRDFCKKMSASAHAESDCEHCKAASICEDWPQDWADDDIDATATQIVEVLM